MNVSAINNSQQIQPKKSTNARKAAALGGLAYSGYLTANVLDELGSAKIARFANSDYEKLAQQIKDTIPFDKFLKREKRIGYAQLGAGIATVMLGALTAGFIVDKCIDAYKSHKAKKTEQSVQQ